MTEYGRRELLYDPELLRHQADQYGREFAIKENVDTPATVVEIRTALRYWQDESLPREWNRWSKRVFETCQMVDRGHFALVGDELKYREDIEQ